MPKIICLQFHGSNEARVFICSLFLPFAISPALFKLNGLWMASKVWLPPNFSRCQFPSLPEAQLKRFLNRGCTLHSTVPVVVVEAGTGVVLPTVPFWITYSLSVPLNISFQLKKSPGLSLAPSTSQIFLFIILISKIRGYEDRQADMEYSSKRRWGGESLWGRQARGCSHMVPYWSGGRQVLP